MERRIQMLQQFESGGALALSLYLNTNPARPGGRNVPAQLAALLRPLGEATKAGVGALNDNVALAEKCLARIDTPPAALAIFTCAATGLRESVPLPGPVVPAAFHDKWLHLQPILAAVDEHERVYAVVLDRQRVRAFRLFFGGIEQILDLSDDDVPGHHRALGAAQRKYQRSHGWSVRMGYGEPNVQRYQDEVVRRHLRLAVAALESLLAGGSLDRLLVFGNPEVAAEFRQLLPRRLAARTTRAGGLYIDATSAQVQEAVTSAQEIVERAGEVTLVQELLDASGDVAVRGLAAVTEAVADGRMHTLVYAQGTTAAGVECDSCGWIMPGTATACGRCDGPVEVLEDVIDRLIARTVQLGGSVEEVRGEAAAMLAESEGVAVLLRYAALSAAPA
ncbi:MAG TPA: hypothetical protein VK928_03455 [Longimicrobiales bacterium]|nr:hypothetical protein [Longimicrobiales bacterium]